MSSTQLVVTSISAPNSVLRALSEGAAAAEVDFIVIGDEKSPTHFEIANCRFYNLSMQRELGLSFATHCPIKRYSRKNIGYLVALRKGAEVIIETDDDNYPNEEFWNTRHLAVEATSVKKNGWVNAYRHFSDSHIWPRGFPLDEIRSEYPTDQQDVSVVSPIQQGLADRNPDVDAIFRLTQELPQSFRKNEPIALQPGTWCPFNSQNTTWFRKAAALLYLPTYCSFRMTDIWRSFVAQRIAWECGWVVTFHSASVWQDRNVHDLMKDFAEEIPGYLHNKAIVETLANLALTSGEKGITDNLRICYSALVEQGVIGKDELFLLDCWIRDVESIQL